MSFSKLILKIFITSVLFLTATTLFVQTEKLYKKKSNVERQLQHFSFMKNGFDSICTDSVSYDSFEEWKLLCKNYWKLSEIEIGESDNGFYEKWSFENNDYLYEFKVK